METETVNGFMELFRGYTKAYGTGRGGWIHQPPTRGNFQSHLEGKGYGLGIGPLREDDTCYFAAIDLDRPDFALAHECMKLLPGTSWLERSRSGNAHVLVFFEAPVEAWVVRGIMRETLAAVGERAVEVFPKNDRLLPGMFGNYLNLCYFGDTRPVVASHGTDTVEYDSNGMPVGAFVPLALGFRNDPSDWRKRARWLGIPSPQERAANTREFGTMGHLHMCAEYVIARRDENPVTAGHRAIVYFNLAKMLTNWSQIDHDEALAMMALVNDASPDPIPSEEMSRILANAERGAFTSTGCDDPLFAPFAHPDCPIANGR